MKIIAKISAMVLLSMIAASLTAQNSNCYLKKTYPAIHGTTLRISNKYGDVNFVTSNTDSISICCSVTIDQDNNELAAKSKSLVSIEIKKVRDTIMVQTNFDKNFFSQTCREGRKRFSADILIKGPAFIDLEILNEFGNVTVDELSGKFSLKLSYGTVSAAKLTRGNSVPINSISVDNGKADLDDINWMSAIIRNCSSFEIDKAQALMIKSDLSKIRIRAVSSMIADSRSDNYIIDSLKNIISESTYTSLNIERFSGKLVSKLTYGTLNIRDLQNEFRDIDITSENALINIVTHGVTFRSDIIATNAPVEFLTKNQQRLIRNTGNNSLNFTGISGADKQSESIIKIRSKSGKVTIK